MHFFTEALDQDYKDPETLWTIYMGRAKLNLLIAQFGRCKEDSIEALKIKPNDEHMWTVLSRSRYFIEKYNDGLKFALQGLEKCPKSEKLLNMKQLFEECLEKEQKCVEEVSSLQALKKDKKLEVYRNLRGKKVKLGKRVHHLPESLELQITEDDDGTLHFPVLLLYDEFMQTDFIQDWKEHTTLREMLTGIFHSYPPWDQECDYDMQSIEVYYENDQTKPLDPKDTAKKKSTKKYTKVDLKQTLLEVL